MTAETRPDMGGLEKAKNSRRTEYHVRPGGDGGCRQIFARLVINYCILLEIHDGNNGTKFVDDNHKLSVV